MSQFVPTNADITEKHDYHICRSSCEPRPQLPCLAYLSAIYLSTGPHPASSVPISTNCLVLGLLNWYRGLIYKYFEFPRVYHVCRSYASMCTTQSRQIAEVRIASKILPGNNSTYTTRQMTIII